MSTAKTANTNFSALIKDLAQKFVDLDKSNQESILEMLDFVQEEIESMKVDYNEDEATEERKAYNKQLYQTVKELKKASNDIGAIYKPGSELPKDLAKKILKIKDEISELNMFAGGSYTDENGMEQKVSFSDQIDYLMSKARMENGLYLVDANHEAIKELRHAERDAQFNSVMLYLRKGKRTINKDKWCSSLASNLTKEGKPRAYPFSDVQVTAMTTALKSRVPTK